MFPGAKKRVTIRPTGHPIMKGKEGTRSFGYTSHRPYIIEGEFDLEVEELGSFVVLRLTGEGLALSYRWTYEDPSGTLQPGDIVQVPFGYDDRLVMGTVVELGRGTWTGATKAVAAKLHREALA